MPPSESHTDTSTSCNHMTCRCTAEFCMVCGSKWKTCECPWFNYRDLPDADRLNDMRIPEPIQVIYRRVFDATAPRPAGARQPEARRGEGLQMRTYTEEVESRRRQERLDEDLARRMQLQSLIDPSPTSSEGARLSRHRRTQTEARPVTSRRAEGDDFALGNAAPHHLNTDFRRSGRGPGEGSMMDFGDTAMGRRGERSSGRRSSKRMSAPVPPPAVGGLIGDFLGSPSVLGMGPSPGARRVGRVR